MGSWLWVEGVESVDHPVDMIAVDGVDASIEQLTQHPGRLRVPGEGQHAEAVEQGGQPARPVEVVEVDGVDALAGQGGGPALRALLDAVEPGRVHEAQLVAAAPPLDDLLPARVAQPQAGQGPPPRRTRPP